MDFKKCAGTATKVNLPAKAKIRSVPHSIRKSKLQMDQVSKSKI